MNIYTIYRATNKINGKMYIGFDSKWPRRKLQHKKDYKNKKFNCIFYRAIRKYGWESFSWDILYQTTENVNKYYESHTLKFMESFFIEKYNTFVFSKNSIGYNMTKGGDGVSLSKYVVNKIKRTKKERFGNENYNNKEKIKETVLKNYGVDVYFQSESFKQASKKTCLEKYGVEFTCQIPEAIEKRKQTILEKYGVEHQAKRMVTCCHCGEYKNINHEKKCKLNPDRIIVVPNNVGGNNPGAKKVIMNGEIFGSISEAAKKFGYTSASLRYYLSGKAKKLPNNIWQLEFYTTPIQLSSPKMA